MKKPYQVGDKVQCLFAPAGSPPHAVAVVRTVTHIEQKVTSIGWLVSADGGQPCPHCGATVPPVPLIDSGYFKLVKSRAPTQKESAADKASKALDQQIFRANIEAQLERS